jgi:hypothetical protein
LRDRRGSQGGACVGWGSGPGGGGGCWAGGSLSCMHVSGKQLGSHPPSPSVVAVSPSHSAVHPAVNTPGGLTWEDKAMPRQPGGVLAVRVLQAHQPVLGRLLVRRVHGLGPGTNRGCAPLRCDGCTVCYCVVHRCFSVCGARARGKDARRACTRSHAHPQSPSHRRAGYPCCVRCVRYAAAHCKATRVWFCPHPSCVGAGPLEVANVSSEAVYETMTCPDCRKAPVGLWPCPVCDTVSAGVMS